MSYLRYLKKSSTLGIGLTVLTLSNLAWAGELVPKTTNQSLPSLKPAVLKDQSVYLNWNVPVDDREIILTEAFTNIDLDLTNNIMNGVNLGSYNGHTTNQYGQSRPTNDPVRNSLKIIDNIGIGNSKGIYATQTSPNKGWSYEYKYFLGPESNTSNESGFFFNDIKQIDASEPILLQFSAAGHGTYKLFLDGGWTGNSAAHESITYNENLSADELRQRFWNRTKIKINNPKGLTYDSLLIATALDTSYSYNFMTIYASIEQQNGEWYLVPKGNLLPWNENARPGQTVAPFDTRQVDSVSIGSPLYYATKIEESSTSITLNENSDWDTYSFNLYAPSTQEVLDLGSYFKVGMAVETDDLLRVGGIQLVQAPTSRVYRDGTLIYEGKSAEFTDYDIADKEAPFAPNINTSLNGTTLQLNWNAVDDQGTSYTYSTRLLYKNGTESSDSNKEIVDYKTGVKEYRIYVNNALHTTTTQTNYTLNNIQNSDTFKIGVVDWAGNERVISVRNPLASDSLGLSKINTAEQQKDNIYLNWDIEIPTSSILFQTDFESTRLDYSQEPSLEVNAKVSAAGKYVDPYGNIWPLTHPIRNSIKILPNLGLNQTSGIKVNKTTDKLGWDYHWYENLPSPNGEANTSSVEYGEWIQLVGDSMLIGRFDVKGNGTITTKIDPGWWTGGSIEDPRFTWAEDLTGSEFWHRLNWNIPIKINNPKGESEQNYHLATALDRNLSYNYLLAQGDIYEENGQWYYKCTYFAYPWKDWVRPEQTVTPDDQRTVSDIKVGQPLYVLESQESSKSKISVNSTDWTSYSLNLTVPNTEIVEALNYYFLVTQTFETPDFIQLDNLTVAYAPKSRLYRDGKLILEDFTVEHTDQNVKDTTAPEKASVSTQYVDGKLQLTWQKVKDKGTIYTYEVSGVNENGQETLRSEPKTVEFTSGVKEYRIYLNGTLIGTTPDLSYQFDQTITSSDRIEVGVVDHAGNENKTSINLLNLTAQAKPSENMIRLDWTGLNNATYQVYQKAPESTEFKPISMVDFSSNNEVVKVLNIYPTHEVPDATGYDLAGKVKKQSAVLEDWIGQYGMGLIQVDSLNMDDFQANPTKWLTNSQGDYKYDVIAVGFWNILLVDQHLNDVGVQAISDFIDSGRGVLVGHHHIGEPAALDHQTSYYQMNVGLNKIREKFGVETFAERNHYYDSTEEGVDIELEEANYVHDFNSKYIFIGDRLKAVRNGGLLNYPHKIADFEKTFIVPQSHHSFTFFKGDTWFQYADGLAYVTPFTDKVKGVELTTSPLSGVKGTNNSYLTTYKNTAIIQTGHSQGATEDEQKILANTLFYLNQLSDTNYLNDHSGQDVKAPDKPRTQSTKALSNGYVEITFDTLTDQGSTYEYYVKATHKNGNSSVVSNIETETITSGVAGVSYIIDTNPDTEPDNQLDSFSNNKIKVKPNSNQTTYLHIKTIDKAGNVSETEHIMISIPKINTAEQRDETIYLNWDIEIPTSSVFWVEDFSSKYLDLPAGNLVTGIAFNANGHDVDHWGVTRPSNDIVRNGVKIIDGVGYNGGRGVVVSQTAPGNGWAYQVFTGSALPVPSVDWSGTRFTDWQKLKTDRPAIARFLTKGEGEFRLNLAADWTGNGVNNEYGYTWAENLTAAEFRTRLENLQPIKVNNPSGTQRGGFHLTTAFDYNYSYNFHLSIGDIFLTNGQWYYYPTAWYGPWSDSVKPGQTVTPAADRTVEPITIGKPLAQLQGTPAADNTIKISSNDWTNYSMNLYLPTSQEIADLGDYFRLMTFFKSYSQMYIDEIKIAYAPKSRLYRNGQLILEDYTVEHTDQDVKDTTAPEKALVSVDYVDGKLQLTWQEVKDKGTIYTYEVSGVNESGQESLRSAPKEVEFISGIKEYRIYLNGTLIDTTTNPNYQFKEEITSSDRIEIGAVDEAGNESKSEIEFLNLTAEAKPSENMIRLDWNALREYTYQVYQKKEGSDEFQSISMTDLSKIQQVKVLNIYPEADDIPSETFTTWEGITYTLPKSASLKKWMEEPNSDHPKGYGQGLINVTPVGFAEFNANSINLLKNVDGSWKYDVIVIGTWDNNGNNLATDTIPNLLKSTAISNVLDFANSGKGLLVGHDVVNNIYNKQWHIDFVPLLNLENSSPVITGDDEVYINKKGLLVSYPWDITTKEILSIPMTHTSRLFSKGDVWLKYVDISDYRGNDNDKLIENESGTNNHYLTTWNNAAMIQTGHSDGEATPDEQKILANTLFYLNQLSSNNYLDDYSGQDVKVPSVPTIQSSVGLDNGYIELTFAPFEDQGSIYDYYVKATHKNGSSEGISNIATETITSGIKGVSYTIDQNQTTEPDNQIDTLSNNKIQIKPSTSGTTYLHIKTIDNAGNISETQHIPLTDPPVLRSEVIDNEYVRLDWATEILPENVLWEIDFESNEQSLINLVYDSGYSIKTGGMEFINNSYSGSHSLYTPNTYPDKGNEVLYPYNYTSWENALRYSGKKIALPNGTPISAAFRIKNLGYSEFELYSDWRYDNKFEYYNSTYLEDHPVGTKTLKVSNIESFKLNGRVSGDRYASSQYHNAHIRSIDVANSTITLNVGLAEPVKAGDQVKYRSQISMFKFDKLYPIKSDKWELYNLNTTTTNPTTFSWLDNPVILRQTWWGDAGVYLDNLVVGHATKVRLYRDGMQIYEGYDAYLNDLEAKDKSKPNTIDLSSLTITSERQDNGLINWNLTFNPASDTGSTYSYQISSVNKYGIESIKSQPVTETVVSGLKGYSYVIDTNPTTDPDNILDLDASTTSISHTGNGTYYLHIKSIDEAGNTSETVHVELTRLELTAEAKPDKNMIRLDWTHLNESMYQVYQKKEGHDEFHSIGTMDFESEKVRVLNVYPDIANKTTSFYSWDGSYHSLPQSAILKQWMEEPNTEHPKGYGKGLITVDTVEISDFNNNPDYYLKNGTTSYQYDVVVFGISDSWGDSKSPALGGDAEVAIDQFLSTGRGVLFGHDTAYRMRSGTLSRVDSFTRLAEKYLNIQLHNLPSSELVLDNFYNGNNPSLTTSYSGTSTIEITKKGLLTNYPWSIGEVGTILTTPYTHTAFQKTGNGDIWMRFNWNNNGMDNPYNSYLYTYNNTAMIQTGHSIAASSNASTIATTDEQKVLANTIFYLKQLSSANSLNDYSAQDVKAPEKPSTSNTHVLSNGYIEVILNDLVDYGSTYDYYVKAIHKSGSEQISNTVSETITTGIKGVSYVIDTNPKTEPDNLVEPLTNQTIQVKPNQTKTTYLHIKTIDNAGNESETLHFELDILTLTAEAKPTENDGKGLVRLDWTNKPEHIYQVYQKKEGSDEFQSISMTDLSKAKQVKVLNLYPTVDGYSGVIYDTAYTTWDGESIPVLPKSASLKRWMEEPNNEHSKGYGKGLIEVTPISLKDFNKNPLTYLKNTDGTWKYDIVMIGSWDNNGLNDDITKDGRDLLIEFLNSNRGVLFGHDTIRGRDTGVDLSPYLNSLHEYIKLEISDIDFSKIKWHQSTAVEISKKGLLTNYPWQIGELGEVLTIPESHTVDQIPGGDIWIKFRGKTSYDEYNYYLTTWNNAAMVQTGHSNGEATPDEQKILANTLFYLNQLSDVNYLNDYSGQDLKAPDKPSIKKHTYTNDGFISLTFDAVKDNGSLYEYYVKATHKNGNGAAFSNIASATVTTGVKGYSWIADNNPDTVPDDIIEQSNHSNIKIPTNNRGPYYLHIKAIDQAGNVSETLHYELTDVDKPTLTLTQNPTDWTNQDVIITATATDHGKVTSGIKEIILPDGNKVAGSTATFTAIQNGTYTFEAVDFMGNRQTASITISNIDKIKPTGSIIIDQNQDEFYEEETEIHINMSDILDGQEKLSGIAKVEIFDVNGTYSHTMTNPTDYQQTLPWVLVPYELSDGSLKAQIGMILTDKAGNTTTVYSKEVTIIKVRVEEFHLTDVINPLIYNKNNPFTRLTYPNIPSQELLSGGSFEFEAIYSYPPTANATWTADYEATIHYIHPTDGRTTKLIELSHQPVDGSFMARHTIPFNIKVGTEVYLELNVKAYNGARKLMGQDSFPDPQGTLLKIGEVTGDIRSLLQFNEIY